MSIKAEKLHVGTQKGSSLIEVLVAVVIISVGLLSVAALQLNALKSNNGSYLRSQASFLAYDLADRMRAVPDASASGVYDDGQGGDRADWDAQVTAALGSGAVGQVVRSNRIVTINVSWNDNRARIRDEGDTDDTTQTTFSYQMEF